MLVGAYSSQLFFHCDLHSFQEKSQPERQPPTYSLTLTSHLHFIIPPAPPRIQSDGKLSPQNTFRGSKRIIQYSKSWKIPFNQGPMNNTKQTETPTCTPKKKDKMSEVFKRKPLFSNLNVLSLHVQKLVLGGVL